MAIVIKTEEDIQKMRVAGRLAAEVLEVVAPYVKPGVSTAELDRICHQHIVDVQQAIPACLNYHGFLNQCVFLLMMLFAMVFLVKTKF